MYARTTASADAYQFICASREQGHYPAGTHYALVIADEAENIAITGEGEIDGQAPEDYGARYGAPQDSRVRRNTIRLKYCRHVALRDFTIRYSDTFTLHAIGCDTVFISGLTIANNLKRLNSDEIDPSGCRNVHTSNCRVVASKDAICLKGERVWAAGDSASLP